MLLYVCWLLITEVTPRLPFCHDDTLSLIPCVYALLLPCCCHAMLLMPGARERRGYSIQALLLYTCYAIHAYEMPLLLQRICYSLRCCHAPYALRYGSMPCQPRAVADFIFATLLPLLIRPARRFRCHTMLPRVVATLREGVRYEC